MKKITPAAPKLRALDSRMTRCWTAKRRVVSLWLPPLLLFSSGCLQYPSEAPDPTRKPMTEGKIPSKKPNFAIVEVHYATNRAATGANAPSDYYGIQASDSIRYGKCQVSIPRDHRMGEIERPSIYRLEFSENPEKHVVLLTVKEKAPRTFYASLNERMGKFSRKKAFVFVHGFNASFAEAAHRTAQMQYDLGFEGAPIFYSWPAQSLSTPQSYKEDEQRIAQSIQPFETFLRELLQKSDASELYFVAHSMGNRLLATALPRVKDIARAQSIELKEIILAAPDITKEVFLQDIAPQLAELDTRITLYASSNDVALRAAQLTDGKLRAGDTTGGIVIVPGVDSIDASEVETDFINHSYFGEDRNVLVDIYNLVSKGKSPDKRTTLRRIESARGVYWKIVK